MTGIVILEYNNSQDTINCIESVQKYNSAPVKFIVVDNGSPNKQVVSELDTWFRANFANEYTQLHYPSPLKGVLPKFTFLVSDVNDGYACGNNKALDLAYADSEIDSIMILNSDVLFVEDIIPSLLKDLKNPNTAIVSPVLYKKDMQGLDTNCARSQMSVSDLIWLYFPFPVDPLHIASKRKIPFHENTGLMPIDLPSGSCMIAKKDLWQKINRFDPNTFLYYEENILWEKIKRLGLKNYLDTNLKCIHLGATTTSKTAAPIKIVKAAYNSAFYFANNWLKANSLQKIILNSFLHLSILRIKIIKLIKKSKL